MPWSCSLGEGEVTGLGTPLLVTFFLPFAPGGQVLVNPSRSSGEMRGWEVTGRCLATSCASVYG
jgi:hypothetical protein